MPAVLLALACAGPTPGGRPSEPGPPRLPATPTAEGFSFAVVGDRTGGHRQGVFASAIERLAWLRPDFVMSVGDLIEGYTEDPQEIRAQWREFDAIVEPLDVSFFRVAGNHDYSNEAMARVWRARHGPSYFHFRHRDVLFVGLNSELFPGVAAEGGIAGPDDQAEQLAWLEDVLGRNRDARWTFVFMHRPLWDRRRVHEDWLRVEAWLGDRPYSVFAGHRHAYTEQIRHGRRFVTLGTTGGASRLRGIAHGEIDHLTWVHVGEGEPVVANLALDGIHGVGLRTADTRDRVRRLERTVWARPLRSEAGSASGDFERGAARFVLHNHGADPLWAEGRIAPGRDLVPSLERLSVELAPGARTTLEVPVSARASGSPGAMAPLPVRWTLRTLRADGAPLEIEQTSWILPETELPCPEAQRPRQVDGRLDEWSALPFSVEARPVPEGAPQGASLRFGVVWDDDFVYLAARVVDPTPRFDASRTARDQDAVQITLDARPAPARDANGGIFHARAEGWLDELVFAWLLPGEAREDEVARDFLPPLPEGTRRAARTTAQGYDVELAIPTRFLDARRGEPWDAFRLNVALQDFGPDGAHITHWWRPSRFGHSHVTPVEGAGTFRKVRTDAR